VSLRRSDGLPEARDQQYGTESNETWPHRGAHPLQL